MPDHSETAQPSTRVAGIFGTIPILGVPVRLHLTFWAVIGFLILSGVGESRSSLTYFLYVLGIFGSVAIHELSHGLASMACGVRTLEVVMFPIGGVPRLNRALRPAEELVIALAGPLANFLLAGGFYLVATRSNLPVSTSNLLLPTNDNIAAQLVFGNLALACFNLLPAFPMDGGRMFRSILAMFRTEDEATRIAAWAGRMLAFSLAVYALFSGVYALVFAAFFIYIGAAQEAAAALGKTLTQGIPVRAAMMTEFRTLPHGATIRDAVNLTLATSQQDFPIMHGALISGLLNRNTILRALAAQGPDAYVAGAMERSFLALSPEYDLAQALPLMARSSTCALVMQGDQLVGLLTVDNLSKFLQMRRYGLDPVERAIAG